MRFVSSIIIGLVLSLSAVAEEQTITYFKSGKYQIALLTLALQKTEASDGVVKLKKFDQTVTDERALSLLDEGAFDVTYMTMNKERAEKYLSVKVDIMKGLLGYRMLLVHKDNVEKFKDVKSLDDLRKYKAGFGTQWGDYPILVANKMPVEGVAVPSRLYVMLENKRFDYFPRGVNEIWGNLAENQKEAPNIVVEPNLMLFYPLVSCFLVSKKNPKLADRIERGLNIALKDGSFKKLFMENFEKDIQKSNLKARKTFTLDNPLPAGMPKIDTSWWL